MDINSTSKLFDGLSSISSDSEDSFLLHKNEIIKKMQLPTKKMGIKLFTRNSPNYPHIRKSAITDIVQNLNKERHTNVGSTVELNNDNACLSIPSSHTLRNSIVAQNITKSKANNSVKSMLMFLNNLSAQKNKNKSQVKKKKDSGDAGTNLKSKQKISTLLSSTMKTTETDVKKNSKSFVNSNLKLVQCNNYPCLSRETQTTNSLMKESNTPSPKNMAKDKKCANIQNDNNTNTFTEAEMDNFLSKFDADIIPQFATVVTISSESENIFSRNLSVNSMANKIPVKSNIFKNTQRNKVNRRTNGENVIASKYNLRSSKTKSKLDSVDIEGTNDNPEVFDVVPRNICNQKLSINTSHNDFYHNNKQVIKHNDGTINPQIIVKFKKQTAKKDKENEEPTVVEKRVTRKRGKTIESKVPYDKNNSEDIEYPEIKKRAKTSGNNNKKSNMSKDQKEKLNNRRKSKGSTKVVVNPKKSINLRNCKVNRKSGFVEVHADNSNNTSENYLGRPRRNRKPPKAFIQATFLSPRVLRQRPVKLSTESKPKSKTTAPKQSKARTKTKSTNINENSVAESANDQASKFAEMTSSDNVMDPHKQVFKKPLRPRKNNMNNHSTETSTTQTSTCNNNEINDSGINTMNTNSKEIVNTTKTTPIVVLQRIPNTDQNEILNVRPLQISDVTCSDQGKENEIELASTSSINTSSSNNCVVIEQQILPTIIDSTPIQNKDTNANIRIELRKSSSFQQIPEENFEHDHSPSNSAVEVYDVQHADNRINISENIIYKNVSVNRNSNIHTVINNEVTSLEWYSAGPSLDMNSSNKSVTVKYCLKDTKTNFATTSCGYLIFAPGEKQIQTSMRHSVTFKVEQGQGAIYIQLQKAIVHVGYCFHIPLGSTYGITNLSQTEQLVLFFNKISVL